MEIDIEKYLEKFKVDEVGTLFGMDWDSFRKGLCPICHRTLYEMSDKPLRYCKNKSHKKFICKTK